METLELLRKVRIFDGLSDDDLSKFAAISDEAGYGAGELIIEEGTEGKALFIVKRGTVSVSKMDQGLETELTKLVAGEHFGEMSLIENAKTSARVKAYNDVQCVRLVRADFRDLLDNNVAIAAKVYRNFTLTLSERLRYTSSELMVWKPDVEL